MSMSKSLLILALLSATPAAFAGTCQYKKVAELPLSGSSIKGKINGEEVSMVVSTGSSRTFVSRRWVDAHHLPLDSTGNFVATTGGTSNMYVVKLDEFAVGPSRTTKVMLPVAADLPGDEHFAAMVGAEFTMQMDMEVFMAGKMLRFFSASGCSDTFLGYWDQGALEVPLVEAGGERDRRPTVTVKLNGKPVDALIDTGTAQSYVFRTAAESAGAHLSAPTQFKPVTGGEKVAIWQQAFEFTLGDETIKNATIKVVDDKTTSYLGRIGMVLGQDWLRAHRVLLAQSQQRMVFSYLGGSLFDAGQ